MACTSALWLDKEEKEKRFCDVLEPIKVLFARF